MFRRRRDSQHEPGTVPGSEQPSDPARRAAQYRVDQEIAADTASASRDTSDETGDAERAEASEDGARGRARRRMDDRALWVDTVVDQAIRRGEFDDLPLAGKPIPGLRGTHDPDWWLKNLVEREQITGVLPAGQLRRDDAELDETLDREPEESRVRTIVEEFNARVVDARRQLLGGPPVVTPTRDVEREVQRWRERRRARGIF
ncbi:DnaJ family domain-containing protein [Isoptericola sp. NPDC057191]|uniref:DnaJ family domain-containing protein n=1 Tax=Isoptericola sp. NPDC057191 TaxID=3346041 RepID=UPI003626DF50